MTPHQIIIPKRALYKCEDKKNIDIYLKDICKYES